MKLIEIRETSSGREVAYLFDDVEGRVIKVFIEDFTRTTTRRMPREEVVEYEEEPAPVRRVARKVEVQHEEDQGELTVEQIVQPKDKAKVMPKSIIPPHLRGVFLPADTPGAAVERRLVG